MITAGLLVAGCLGSKYTYVKNSRDNAYFRVPDDWRVYDEDTVLDSQDLSEERAETLRSTLWTVLFDSHPDSTLKKALSIKPRHKFPYGSARVLRLTESESDIISTEVLRNLIAPVDQLAETSQAEVLEYEPLALEDGFRGVHLVANIFDTESNTIITINGIAISDQLASKVYVIEVSCEEECYNENKRDLERIIDSWTVED